MAGIDDILRAIPQVPVLPSGPYRPGPSGSVVVPGPDIRGTLGLAQSLVARRDQADQMAREQQAQERREGLERAKLWLEHGPALTQMAQSGNLEASKLLGSLSGFQAPEVPAPEVPASLGTRAPQIGSILQQVAGEYMQQGYAPQQAARLAIADPRVIESGAKVREQAKVGTAADLEQQRQVGRSRGLEATAESAAARLQRTLGIRDAADQRKFDRWVIQRGVSPGAAIAMVNSAREQLALIKGVGAAQSLDAILEYIDEVSRKVRAKLGPPPGAQKPMSDDEALLEAMRNY